MNKNNFKIKKQMKKILIFLAVVLITLQGFAQPISTMTTYTGSTNGSFMPVIIPVGNTFSNRKYPLDSLLTKAKQRTDSIAFAAGLSGKLNYSDTSTLSNRINLKQNTLTAGTNITIVGNTINASNIDTTFLSNRINLKLNSTDTASLSNRINTKQNTLVAGTNITITGNTISASGGGGGGGSQSLDDVLNGNRATDTIIEYIGSVPEPSGNGESAKLRGIYRTILPSLLPSASGNDWYQWQTATNFPGGTHQVMKYGWNMNGGGGPVVLGKSGLGESWEHNYFPVPGSPLIDENHKFWIRPQTGFQQRIQSYTLHHNSMGQLYHNIGKFGLKIDTVDNGSDFYFSAESSFGTESSMRLNARNLNALNIIQNNENAGGNVTSIINENTVKANDWFNIIGYNKMTVPKVIDFDIDQAANTLLKTTSANGSRFEISTANDRALLTTYDNLPLVLGYNQSNQFVLNPNNTYSHKPFAVLSEGNNIVGNTIFQTLTTDKQISSYIVNNYGVATSYGAYVVSGGNGSGNTNIGVAGVADNGSTNIAFSASVPTSGSNNFSLRSESISGKLVNYGNVGIGDEASATDKLLVNGTVSTGASKIKQSAADPTTSDIPSGYSETWKNTTTGNVSLFVNNSGTIVKVQGQNEVKTYVALLTQSGTGAPTATVLSNTTGGTIAFTRTGVGTYLGTITGGTFPTNKTSFNLSNQSYTFDNDGTPSTYDCHVNWTSTTTFTLNTRFDGAAFDAVLGASNQHYLTITIYP